MAIDISVEELAEAIGAATLEVDAQGRRIAVSLWNLARGRRSRNSGWTRGTIGRRRGAG